MIRLYSHMSGSFETVSRGLELAFRKLQVLDGVYLGEDIHIDDHVPGGADSPIAVVCGDPMRILQAHYQGKHKQQWLLLAPNSEGIPQSFVRQLKDEVKLPGGEKRPVMTGLLAPSTWAMDILKKEFPEHPVLLCPHGVLPEFRMNIDRRAYAKGYDGFRILHVTSSRLSRKCTKQLIQAWKMFKEKTKTLGSLDILVNPAYVKEFSEYVSEQGAGQAVLVVPGQNFQLTKYVEGMQGYQFVVQPSRAEGFGLVPLEARACGVPVIGTRCTGHADHMQGAGVVVVEHGESGPSDDYLGATAPTVNTEHIYKAIFDAYKRREELHDAAVQEAAEIATQWTWEKQVAPAVEQIRELI